MDKTLSLTELAEAVKNIALINNRPYFSIECCIGQHLPDRGNRFELRAYIDGMGNKTSDNADDLLSQVRQHYMPKVEQEIPEVVI